MEDNKRVDAELAKEHIIEAERQENKEHEREEKKNINKK